MNSDPSPQITKGTEKSKVEGINKIKTQTKKQNQQNLKLVF